jgi:hypothetical protein
MPPKKKVPVATVVVLDVGKVRGSLVAPCLVVI